MDTYGIVSISIEQEIYLVVINTVTSLFVPLQLRRAPRKSRHASLHHCGTLSSHQEKMHYHYYWTKCSKINVLPYLTCRWKLSEPTSPLSY